MYSIRTMFHLRKNESRLKNDLQVYNTLITLIRFDLGITRNMQKFLFFCNTMLLYIKHLHDDIVEFHYVYLALFAPTPTRHFLKICNITTINKKHSLGYNKTRKKFKNTFTLTLS